MPQGINCTLEGCMIQLIELKSMNIHLTAATCDDPDSKVFSHAQMGQRPQML